MKRAIVLLCAWVLWSQSVNRPGTETSKTLWVYYTENAFETRQACLDALEVLQKEANKGKFYSTFLCLPDTVDPRGRN